MDIPDEVLVRLFQLADSDPTGPDADSYVFYAEELRTALRAFLPAHARSARVAILREVAAELRRASWTSADPVEAEVAKGVALAIGRTIERRADELEASAGQTLTSPSGSAEGSNYAAGGDATC